MKTCADDGQVQVQATIGLIGGMSWESSSLYYRHINEMVRDRLGALHSAKCILFSVDFADIEAMQSAGNWEAAGEVLANAARRLEAAGADFLVLCTNTMHKVADQITAAVSIPLLHLADAAAADIIAKGVRTVGLLGTAFTMEQAFYTDRLISHGLIVLTPPPGDRAEIHRIIYEELCRGVISEASRASYLHIIADLVTAGAQGIILGCTEIELLIEQKHCTIPVFPTTAIHARAAVDFALSEKLAPPTPPQEPRNAPQDD
ncbi:aspartate/glutamate racemase family protein [Nakamurella antarctica]|uniref:Aspartate/glutamate racemase family protein n=1 Tax=Nakamurella antarctica TaxID=1902245 RepID=A0A3G8ZLM9_9ACTN|nr:aspartate/glutamate racemase family protein [Nakamurella antarctica]AZI58120.1 aspartate/glutamate racemase family protein [Nakamurella antarctica]